LFNKKFVFHVQLIFLFLFTIKIDIVTSQPTEYLVKAVFLEKFTHFVEWPSFMDIDDTSKPFIIGVLGDNPFEFGLNQLFENQKIKNKNVEIRYYQDIDQINTCHLLFISKSEMKKASSIIRYIKNKPILTIGDFDSSSGMGVIINLKLIGNKIRFEIDEKAALESGLHVSYLLLKEAIIVNPVQGNQ
jgi:hypothetical protein